MCLKPLFTHGVVTYSFTHRFQLPFFIYFDKKKCCINGCSEDDAFICSLRQTCVKHKKCVESLPMSFALLKSHYLHNVGQ